MAMVNVITVAVAPIAAAGAAQEVIGVDPIAVDATTMAAGATPGATGADLTTAAGTMPGVTAADVSVTTAAKAKAGTIAEIAGVTAAEEKTIVDAVVAVDAPPLNPTQL